MSGKTRASADRQVNVGGEVLTLRFSARALAALQDYWQLKTLDQVAEHLNALEGANTIDDLAAILWASLRTHHPEVDRETAIDLLDEMGVPAFEAAFGDALAGSASAPKEEGGGGSAPARPRSPGRSKG